MGNTEIWILSCFPEAPAVFQFLTVVTCLITCPVLSAYLPCFTSHSLPAFPGVCVCVCVCVCVRARLVTQPCPTLCDPRTCQSPLSMVFPRQAYWSGFPFPSPGDLPHPGIEPASLVSPALESDSLPAEPMGKAIKVAWNHF